jgi:D-alanyl-D-alanine carboxypeptidase (penicillin-binding protein 5/6)
MTPSRTHTTLRPGSYLTALIIFMLLPISVVFAGNKILIPAAPRLASTSYFLQDYYSGKILTEKNADEKLAPASLTKILAVYTIFHELKSGHLTLEESVTISKKAWRTGGSRMFVEVNKQVPVKALLRGIIIQSGNDASVALAEHIAGDEITFANMMNQHADRLGMLNTHYTNSMGLPSDDHYTTARDQAILTHALIQEFPEQYAWFAEKEFTFNKITQQNRNKLLWRDASVDGVKTGYTEKAGYCLVASAIRENMRLISVVMGAKSPNARSNENQTLLNYGFRFFETHRLYSGLEPLAETRIWKGAQQQLPLGLSNDLYVTIPRRHYNDLKAVVNINKRVNAPVKQGENFGSVDVTLAGEPFINRPLVALQSIDKGSFFQRIYDQALLLLK